MEDSQSLKIDMSRGLIAIIEITCLPGKEKSAFCHGIRSMCNQNKYGFSVFGEDNDVFPVVLQCLCGLEYTFNEIGEIPVRSKQCVCGTYVVKYENHPVH